MPTLFPFRARSIIFQKASERSRRKSSRSSSLRRDPHHVAVSLPSNR